MNCELFLATYCSLFLVRIFLGMLLFKQGHIQRKRLTDEDYTSPKTLFGKLK